MAKRLANISYNLDLKTYDVVEIIQAQQPTGKQVVNGKEKDYPVIEVGEQYVVIEIKDDRQLIQGLFGKYMPEPGTKSYILKPHNFKGYYQQLTVFSTDKFYKKVL